MSDAEKLRGLLRWEDLDFAADCQAWGNWFATFIMPNPWSPAESLDGSLAMSLKLMQSAVNPLLLTAAMTMNVTEAELAGETLGWWAYQVYDTVVLQDDGTYMIDLESKFVENVVKAPSRKCPDDLCKAFGYSGNNDITGIGIHSSYYMQAVLATLYLLAFTIACTRNVFTTKEPKHLGRPLLDESHNGALSRRKPSPNLSQRTIDAFRGSLDAFLASCMLMSVAMLCAAITLAVEGTKERRTPMWEQVLPYGDSSVYNMVLSVIAAGFSVFPVIVVYLLISRRDRGGVGMQEGLPVPRLLNKGGHRTGSSVGHRAWIRRVAIFIIWVLITVEVFLSPRGNMDYDDRHDAEKEAGLNVCSKRGGVRYWQTMKAAQWLVIGAPLLWMVVTAFLATGFGVPGLAGSRLVRAVRSVWDLAIAWLNMLLAWGLLAYFTVLRHKIIDTAEEVDSGNEWGFGQILALATWMPVVLEFLYIFIWGIEDRLIPGTGLGYQVSRGASRPPPPRSGTWTALESKPSESDFGPSRSETVVTYPYEGAGGEQQKYEWNQSVDMAQLPESLRVGETTARIDSGDTLHERREH